MPQPLERRKKLRRKAVQPTGPTWVLLENVPGARADIRAKVVDFSETGLRVHVSLWLRASRLVVVKGDAGVVPNGKANARVVDCRPLAGSGYTAGLTFVESSAKNTGDETPGADYYEILQVSRKADQETIAWVYKLHSQRYRPENRKTGDPKIFQAINEAYRILSDPTKRAEYDLKV
jgi:DnaJ domain